MPAVTVCCRPSGLPDRHDGLADHQVVAAAELDVFQRPGRRNFQNRQIVFRVGRDDLGLGRCGRRRKSRGTSDACSTTWALVTM